MGQLICSKGAKIVQWGKGQFLEQIFLEKLDNHMQKNETALLSYTIHKNQHKMGKKLKCKT